MEDIPVVGEYEYGFSDEAEIIFSTGRGLTEEVVRQISQEKQEPDWMLEYRLKAFEYWKTAEKTVDWGVDLSDINWDKFIYYQKASDRPARSWDDVPDEIKETFDRLGVPEAEREYLAGSTVQYESEAVYSRLKSEFEEKGIIFTDMDTAVREYPELVKEYFGSVVDYDENFQTALNYACWSGGTFIYVPKNVKVDVPVQTYFRINNENAGQFERTLIIVEEGASIQYVEGCTAPTWSSSNLHAAIVEVIVKKDAFCRYTTIQNWSKNVINLVTERSHVYEGATMEWVDGNIGSSKTMKFPACVLKGRGANGTIMSVAYSGAGQHQQNGSKMIHLAPNTTSNVVSKSIAADGGYCDYIGQTYFGPDADGAKCHVDCDTMILDQNSRADTFPYNTVQNNNIDLEHEAKVSKISEDQLFYLMSRGLDEGTATEMIITGFVAPFTKELPMEYAVEINRLIAYEMDGIG